MCGKKMDVQEKNVGGLDPLKVHKIFFSSILSTNFSNMQVNSIDSKRCAVCLCSFNFCVSFTSLTTRPSFYEGWNRIPSLLK